MRAAGATPHLAAPVAMPRAVQAQVRVQRQAVVEVDQQVLALRVDVEHRATDHPLELRAAGSATRRADLLADEQRTKDVADAREGVALRHGGGLRSGA